LREVAQRRSVDEKADVGADALLLVDHAKTDSRVLPLQIGKHRSERGCA
jgi:hypothetical protein